MAKFIHSILEANQVVAADGDQTVDLPVNPLSLILMHISPLNDTGTITDYTLMQGLLSAIDSIRITHKGSAIIDGSGVDLAVVALLWHKMKIWQSNAVETNNDRRSLVLPICFGRSAFDPLECFPETRKGELQMTTTFDIADTGFDALRMSIETVELPDANPTHIQKVTTLAQTFAATGQNDIDLPIGNLLRAILLFGTTGFAGAAPAPTLGQIELLVDNIQTHFSGTDFEVLRGLHGVAKVSYPPDFSHFHGVDAAGVGQEDTQRPAIGASIDDNYVLLDVDPTRDDLYSIDTKGAARINVRVDAEAANAVRALPIERVVASQFIQ